MQPTQTTRDDTKGKDKGRKDWRGAHRSFAVSSAQSKRGLQRVAVAYDGMRATVYARQIVCLGLFTPQRDLALRRPHLPLAVCVEHRGRAAAQRRHTGVRNPRRGSRGPDGHDCYVCVNVIAERAWTT